MGRRKVNKNIRSCIARCLRNHQRSLFFILGQNSRNQVVFLHHLFLKVRDHVKLSKPSVIWCYKKDNGLIYACHKIQKSLKKKYSGNYTLSEEDCFDFFLASTTIQFCHYNDTTSVLGQTFDMLIIQDFEAVTPNILARIIECVEGGGMIIMLFSSANSLQEISSLKMDAHSRYITHAFAEINPVFNFRFVLSLADCENCMILDDDLNVLHCPKALEPLEDPHFKVQKGVNEKPNESNNVLDRITSQCVTEDQKKALQTFISTLKQKSMKSVASLTSSRGRGKSAALGLSISCALHLRYSNIYVTSPHIENIQTLFQFVINGIKAIDYEEGKDYSIVLNTVENVKLISGINVFHDHRQVVKYITPTEFFKIGISDLVIIDEAAAIPLPIVKKWLESDIVFMASTTNGYEGTGRSLSLKLMKQLRERHEEACSKATQSDKNFTLHEVTLNESIRYANGDCVEAWLNKLFCLETEITYFDGAPPSPERCQLYYVDKKILFSYQKVAEKFLQQLVALFVSSHYKNSPNDLLMMADAPSHHLFCLASPVNKSANCLPDVLCVIQVALEGNLPQNHVIQELSHGKRASGDMIPWIISQQFQDNDFPSLSGARVVRIATHPNYQRMGYGQQALQLLFSHYAKSSKNTKQTSDNMKEKTVLLHSIDELQHANLDYIGVSYGLTIELLRFWKKMDFVPLYLRQTASETTGEHSCVMVKSLSTKISSCLPVYLCDFLERFSTLLTSAFKNLSTMLALEILQYKRNKHFKEKDYFNKMNIFPLFTECSIKRLEAYCNHLVDYHLIMDLMPILAKCYFLGHFKEYFLSSIQEAVLLSMGLQNKSVEEISVELEMETNQVMGIFIKVVNKMYQHLGNLEKNSEHPKVQKVKFYNVETGNQSLCESNGFKRKIENFHNKKKKQKQKHFS